MRIWSSHTSREFLDARGLTHYEEGDIGCMYGWNWRHFGAQYAGCGACYDGAGHDQLKEVLRLLRTDPMSRRIVMTTYDPMALAGGVLEPCHGLVTQFYVNGDRLSCHMYQRSADAFLGLPFNIASYAALTYVLAAKSGLKPAELVISLGDAHIYRDHFQQVAMQVGRNLLPFPKLVLDPSVREKDFEELTVVDFDVVGYIYHPAIRGRMSV